MGGPELDKGGLTVDKGVRPAVGEAGNREDDDLLAACNGVNGVDVRNVGFDHGLGVVTEGGGDGHAVDVGVGLGQHLGEGASQ